MIRPNGQPHVAASDCERCRHGVVAQPANAASSLAYVGAGGVILQRNRDAPRRSEVVLGWSAIAAGLGSVAYHGPGTTLGRFAHDAGLISMLAMVVVADTELTTDRTAPGPLLAAVPAIAAALAVRPASSMVAQAVVGGGAIAGEVARFVRGPSGRARPVAAAVLAGGGAVAHLLGRAGGPWCRPDSWFQPHALWHVATAAVIGLRETDQPPPSTHIVAA